MSSISKLKMFIVYIQSGNNLVGSLGAPYKLTLELILLVIY